MPRDKSTQYGPEIRIKTERGDLFVNFQTFRAELFATRTENRERVAEFAVVPAFSNTLMGIRDFRLRGLNGRAATLILTLSTGRLSTRNGHAVVTSYCVFEDKETPIGSYTIKGTPHVGCR